MAGAVRAVSVEGPEAAILAGQMRQELVGKTVAGFALGDTRRLQEIGFMNRDADDYRQLVSAVVESVVSRGNTVLLKLDNGSNLVISPEYGGDIFYWEMEGPSPEKYHLRLDFEDSSFLTIRITSMGGTTATCDAGLTHHYLVARDFNPETLDPLDPIAGGFTLERFSATLEAANKAMKTVMVGKEAVLAGISNSTFQDVLYRAGIHPKRKASELSPEERSVLFDAIRFVLDERLRLGGKDQWRDLYGRPGGYVPAMGPGMGGQTCAKCGGTIEKLALGGGDVNVCPVCQR
jgi:formamidopyrimidine-DNA glycosylase